MSLIDRYVARYVVSATLMSLLALLALFSFIALVDDLDSVGKGDYTLWLALEYMVLSMPRLAFSLFPVAAIVGSLMGLGVLAGNSELVVIRAAGVSVARIIGAVLRGAGVLVVVAVLLGEVLSPAAERLAEERRSFAMSGELGARIGTGFWVRDGDSFINIGKVLPEGRMDDVHVYELGAEQRLRVVTHAAQARYTGGEWRLREVRQTGLEEPPAATSRYLPEAAWRSVLEPDLVRVVSVRPESLSLVGLVRYVDYLEGNGLDAARYRLAMWTKIVYPLTTALMIVLAVPMVLGRLRSVGLGQRVLLGIAVGVAFHVAHQVSGHLGLVYGLSPFACAVLPSLALAGVGWWLVRSVR
ncbi:MAG: LPS export ABC transporter permease LptG [Ectothiorhodospiraceae bacterium]|nr:LPS export ABC transporter permease LptG [Chromatiales bacterium]MCP5155000.1 LPS export ABC transporter permease LptG [Ectothiorhodospiraceae bacterium]